MVIQEVDAEPLSQERRTEGREGRTEVFTVGSAGGRKEVRGGLGLK